jgi:hypothetical protein
VVAANLVNAFENGVIFVVDRMPFLAPPPVRPAGCHETPLPAQDCHLR